MVAIAPQRNHQSRRRCDHFGNRRLLLVGDLGHVGDLGEIEIVKMANPHHPGYDMGPDHNHSQTMGINRQVDLEQMDRQCHENNKQDEPGNHSISKRGQDWCHGANSGFDIRGEWIRDSQFGRILETMCAEGKR